MIFILAMALVSYIAAIMFYNDGERMEALTMLTMAFVFAIIPSMVA